jgi:hypothetical protein
MATIRDPLIFLDPTDEREPIARRPAHRPAALAGTIGLVDISKPRGDVFLDEVERLIHSRHPELRVARFSKPTFTKPTPDDLREEVSEGCAAVIQALAD